MLDEAVNRRRFLQLGATAGLAALAPRWMNAQSPTLPDRVLQGRAAALNAPITTTKLYDNVYLLANGVGGNMVLQTGSDGDLLIDSSFTTAVPKVRQAIAAVSHNTPDALINTHWHYDHTDGNADLHAAGFTVLAHRATRDRMSAAQTIPFFHLVMPASTAAALPSITFDDAMHAWLNGDTLDLVHFDPAHTDTDIYIHFHRANVLHVGDIWFNGMYPFFDEATGGVIGGMIRASEKALSVADSNTKIIPGHGPMGSKADLQKFHDMLSAVRDKVAAIKASGASEQEAISRKPTAEFDPVWSKGFFVNGDVFTGLVYRTI
ncbi:MAG: MBL fold metallo-hydrolase [Terracidiphilus sp.]|jgi:glyoxylase-like metal-dependent hydrolase (beta-lactamase superfamily II)